MRLQDIQGYITKRINYIETIMEREKQLGNQDGVNRMIYITHGLAEVRDYIKYHTKKSKRRN